MTVNVAYANQTERLLDLLSAHILAHRQDPRSDPLRKWTVVVPNGNVAAWLRLGIAERVGISACLEFPYLESFFRKIVQEAIPGCCVLDIADLQALLLDDWRGEPWRDIAALEPIAAYAERGSTPHEREARRIDLAAAVARVFDNYSLSRRAMVESWVQGKLILQHQPVFAAMEKWQSALWCRVFGPGGLVADWDARSGLHHGLLATLLYEARAELCKCPGGDSAVREDVFIFGFSYVAKAYVDAFQALAQGRDVHLLTLNPCAESWDDLQTMGEEIREARKRRRSPQSRFSPGAGELGFVGEDPFQLDRGTDNVVLKLWGRPGRNYIRVVNDITGCEFLPLFVDPGTDTLLHRLQHDILTRQGESSQEAAPAPDRTLQLCPSAGGVTREAEFIANEIWHLMAASTKSGQPLRFHEIAVVLPGAEKEIYEAQLGAAFRECHHIPFRVVDSDARTTSGLVSAFCQMLESCGKPIQRELLLDILVHPALLVRHGGEREVWTRLAAQAGIFVGGDSQDLLQTYIQEDVFHWDQGLARIALGTVCIPADDRKAVELKSGRQLQPMPLEATVRDKARIFVVLARALLADLRFIGTEKVSWREWSEYFRAMLLSHLGPYPEEPSGEVIARQRVLEVIARVADLPSQTPVGGREACGTLLQALEGVRGSASDYLTDGVSIASFLPMRPLPFRVVFVVGMGEGNFPSADVLSPLDLRNAVRMAYDVRPRDQDKYMFLETLLSVRERLYISWVGRSEADGSCIEPSGLVKELLQALRDMGMENFAISELWREIPLRRFASSAFAPNSDSSLPGCLLPAAWRERAAQQGCVRAESPQLVIERFTQSGRRHSLQLNRLQKFLAEPLGAVARFAHRMDAEEYQEEVRVQDEPLEPSEFSRKRRLREVALDACLSTSLDAEAHTAAEAGLARLQMQARILGEIPAGFLGDLASRDERDLMTKLLARCARARALVPAAHPVSWTVGCAGAPQSFRRPAHPVQTSVGTVFVSGRLEVAFLSDNALVVPIFLWGREFTLPDKVGALLTLSLLVCSGVSLPQSVVLAGIRIEDASDDWDENKMTARLSVPDLEGAERWLALLCEHWLSLPSHAYLPLKKIGIDDLNSEEELLKKSSEVFEKVMQSLGSDYSELARISQLVGRVEKYPPTRETVALLRARLLPILGFLQSGEKA